MKPDFGSRRVLSITQSKAKMYEYSVPLEEHIDLTTEPARLFPLAIGLLGDLAARINEGNATEADIEELCASLPFSARFFDAFIETRLNQENDGYVRLLGSAAYYLCNLHGSATILAEGNQNQGIDFGTQGLEKLLLWLLLIKDFPTTFPEIPEGIYKGTIGTIRDLFLQFNATGLQTTVILEVALQLRSLAYELGTPRELLLADLVGATIRKRIDNSTWICLPKYTDLPIESWAEVIKKKTFIREFWAAQHLLGEKGVFRGKSAIVQMPTSAGKTKATEVIIRSAFLSNRISLAVIIAPFRALCHEIRQGLIRAFQGESIFIDELSDVLQKDYSVERILRDRNVLVATPEKFNYVLRHEPELAKRIGLIIYDEGHQFDNGTRGITYELLLTSLKARIVGETQTVLISAVISNADQIGKWLINDSAVIVDGLKLAPTYKSIGFATVAERSRNLYFVDSDNIDRWEYFVPRIFTQYSLKRRVTFPHLDDGKEVALFLGIKLSSQGSVAVFSGTKDSVGTMCETLVKAFRNGLPLSKPSDLSTASEIQKLTYLHDLNLGENASYSKSARLGVFAHHNNIPHGIRLAVEYAMKEGLAKFVICTSTLAQGVNLPIRYLIVTSVFQGRDKITVRDFQNLIGRSGRSGMHTEGSILFADPIIYDERRHWRRVKTLLDPSKSEECDSQLLSLLKPLYSDDNASTIEIDINSLITAYQSGKEVLLSWVRDLSRKYAEIGFTESGLQRQVNGKVNTISAIESYLMANGELAHLEDGGVLELARGTLAYFLAEEEEKRQIEELFVLLVKIIEEKIPEPQKRVIFGKTMYGVPDSLAISSWVDEHYRELNSSMTTLELFEALWSLIEENINNRSFRKCDQPDAMKSLAISWINGVPFHKLFDDLVNSGAKYKAGSKLWDYSVERIVDVCENGFGYEGILLLGALIELLPALQIENVDFLISSLQYLQKILKYGLPDQASIVLYELGFADRIVALELSSIFREIQPTKELLLQSLKAQREEVFTILDKYPSYFSQVYENVAT